MQSEELNRAIGRLEGITQKLDEQNTRAEEGRKVLHQKVDAMAHSVDDVKSEMAHVDQRLSKIEPVVGEFSRWRERGIGALMVMSGIAAACGAILTLVWDKALHLMGWK